MKTTRILAFTISALVAGTATPAFAKASRTSTSSKHFNVDAATDDQLNDEVAVLQGKVLKQENAVQAAQQASSAAQSVVDAAEAVLAKTDGRMSALRSALSDHALEVYMHPSRDSILDIMRAGSLAEAGRRQALLDQVLSSDQQLLDELRAVREDQDAARAKVAKARDIVKARRQAAIDALKSLASSQGEHTRLRAALDARIASFIDEADAVESQQASITALIKAKEGAYSGPVSTSGLIWPVRGPINSPFGMRWGRMHTGIDIGAGMGTPIHAAKSGVVIMAGWNGGYGNCTIINHGGGFSTLYGHQSRILVHEGESVTQGQVIGYVGSTGHSTGPHLHFETRVGGTPVNPRKYL